MTVKKRKLGITIVMTNCRDAGGLYAMWDYVTKPQ